MKLKLVVAVIVFVLSMFCGLVIVTDGILAGKYETLFPYTEKDVCAEGEKLVLEKYTSTTGGTVVIDGNIYSDAGFTENTLYCVKESTGEKREVTNETYDAVEKLRTRIGWYATIGIFVAIMIVYLLMESRIIKKVDSIIGYQPPQKE